jgi:hypothetical protein
MNPDSQVEVRALQAIREARKIRAELEESLYRAAHTIGKSLVVERQLSDVESSSRSED